ncbi:MAG: hypothetical protein HFG75_02560 [Hungatella sp.]|nr:hypothetical protein [Hungatella sp.]
MKAPKGGDEKWRGAEKVWTAKGRRRSFARQKGKGRRKEPGEEMEKADSQWKEVDERKLTTAERCVYRNRRKAIELYKKGYAAMEIFRLTGLNGAAVVRLWNRCCEKDPETGQCCGYEALVPRSRIKRFIR